MGDVEQTGKHAGKRRAEPAPKPTPVERTPREAASGGRSRVQLLLLALGVTLALVAWGYLVYAAIDFGSTARGGKASAWWFLGLASLGAVACLFIGLLLVSRLLRLLGLLRGAPADTPPPAPRPVGGKRIAR